MKRIERYQKAIVKHTRTIALSIANCKICEDGKDGRDGEDGRDGLDGRDGRDGRDGENGKDGKDGRDGKDGECTGCTKCLGPAPRCQTANEGAGTVKDVIEDLLRREGGLGLTGGHATSLGHAVYDLHFSDGPPALPDSGASASKGMEDSSSGNCPHSVNSSCR